MVVMVVSLSPVLEFRQLQLQDPPRTNLNKRAPVVARRRITWSFKSSVMITVSEASRPTVVRDRGRSRFEISPKMLAPLSSTPAAFPSTSLLLPRVYPDRGRSKTKCRIKRVSSTNCSEYTPNTHHKKYPRERMNINVRKRTKRNTPSWQLISLVRGRERYIQVWGLGVALRSVEKSPGKRERSRLRFPAQSSYAPDFISLTL